MLGRGIRRGAWQGSVAMMRSPGRMRTPRPPRVACVSIDVRSARSTKDCKLDLDDAQSVIHPESAECRGASSDGRDEASRYPW